MSIRIRRNVGLAFSALALLVIFAGLVTARAEGEPTPAAAGTPLANWPETKYDFGSSMEGADVSHNFIVENKGKATLEIQKVQPD